MTRRTKALAITPAVRGHVMERDEGRCVRCGRTDVLQCAHYIGRAQSGLGVERNLVMLCADCHMEYDQSAARARIREELRDYLRGCYPDWDETTLTYDKWRT